MIGTYWAPGRANLIGEHTDYSGGLALPVAIDLGVTIEGEPDLNCILLTSDAFPDVVDLRSDGEGRAMGWGRHVAAVAIELAELGRPPIGLRGSVRSNLPIGAGVSSSAALQVAVATALCGVAAFELDPLELALAAQHAEHRAVGVPCGVLDQMASVLGKAGHAVLIDTQSLTHRLIPFPVQLDLVILYSGFSRSLEDGRYSDRRRELERALACLGGRRPAELSMLEFETIAASLDPIAKRRLRHVVTENERVRKVASILLGDGRETEGRLGELFRQGHDSLRDDFEVSTPQLDLLVDLSYRYGATAARMTGAGFGGSIIALVRHERADLFTTSVLNAYRVQFDAKAVAHLARASDGARTITSPSRPTTPRK